MNRHFSPFRIGVFYDANFFLHTSNYYNYFHKQNSRLCINGLHKYLCRRVAEELRMYPEQCLVSEAHYYRGRVNAVEASQRGNQLYNDRVFEDILMADGVQTHYLPLRDVTGRKEERGIDILLSLEAFEAAVTKRVDAVALILSDTDYVPLIRKINSQGVRTVLLGWEFAYVNDDGNKVVTKTSHELQQVASIPLLMHEEIEDGLLHEEKMVQNIFVNPGKQEEFESQGESEIIESEVLSLKSGFGFIKYPNNNLYFHQQDVLGNFFNLEVGDKVECTLGINHRGESIARNVKKL